MSKLADRLIEQMLEADLDRRYQDLERHAKSKATGATLHRINNMLMLASGYAELGDIPKFNKAEKEITTFLMTRITPARFHIKRKKRPGRYGEDFLSGNLAKR